MHHLATNTNIDACTDNAEKKTRFAVRIFYYILSNEIQANIDYIKCIYFTAVKI